MASTTATGSAARVDGDRSSAVLRYTAAFYALPIVLHTADHIRRGIGSTTSAVLVAGTVATLLAAIAIALVFAKRPSAPVVAVFVGFGNAAGVAAVHLLPRWSALSDAFPGGTVGPASWTAVLLEIAAALAFGAAGLFELARPRGLLPDSRAGRRAPLRP